MGKRKVVTLDLARDESGSIEINVCRSGEYRVTRRGFISWGEALRWTADVLEGRVLAEGRKP